MNHTDQTNIAIIGTGPAGLLSKLACVKYNWTSLCIGPSIKASMHQKDTRTTALFSSSIEFLKNLGIWEQCAIHATPLTAIRLIDTSKNLFRAPETLFNSEELGLKQFGFNITNAKLVETLYDAICQNPNANFLHDNNISKITMNTSRISLHCSDEQIISANLVIAADGRNSISRKYASINTKNWSYPQTAIACNFSHQYEHENISNEFHYETGPCTTVPMSGKQSSLVWVVTPNECQRLMELPEESFCSELYERLHGILGEISSIGPRANFPLSGLTANNFAKNGIALVGEAAHVIPPIGAQGLNLGFRDVATIIETIAHNIEDNEHLNVSNIISSYDKKRHSDVISRTIAIDMLNRSLLANFLPVQISRSLILGLLKQVPPLRKFIMKQGIQSSFSLPELMKPGNIV